MLSLVAGEIDRAGTLRGRSTSCRAEFWTGVKFEIDRLAVHLDREFRQSRSFCRGIVPAARMHVSNSLAPSGVLTSR